MNEIANLVISKSSELILINDIPSNLEIVSETLNSVGYNVAIFISGERALQRLKQHALPLQCSDRSLRLN